MKLNALLLAASAYAEIKCNTPDATLTKVDAGYNMTFTGSLLDSIKDGSTVKGTVNSATQPSQNWLEEKFNITEGTSSVLLKYKDKAPERQYSSYFKLSGENSGAKCYDCPVYSCNFLFEEGFYF